MPARFSKRSDAAQASLIQIVGFLGRRVSGNGNHLDMVVEAGKVDGKLPSNPYRDELGLVILGQLLKPDPRLPIWKHERIADYGPREWARRLDFSFVSPVLIDQDSKYTGSLRTNFDLIHSMYA